MAKKARKVKGRKPSPARRKKSVKARRPAARRASARRPVRAKATKAKARKTTARKSARPAKRPKARLAAPKPAKRAKAGGTGQEATLAQTPATGRTVSGPTNPMPTRRSTGTAAGAGGTRQAPGLERERRRLREIEESVQGPPSSLNMDRHGSAARSGRAALQQAKRDHTETSPAMTGGDVDADWEDAYAVGDEAPGGDNPTPDQDRVDDIGRALGIEYADNEELKAADKIAERDRHRWELDPASAEDYPDHDQDS